jgi:hypothetical protein
MATIVAGAPAGFSIGRVVSRIFGAVGKNFFAFLALSLVSVSPLLLMFAAAPTAMAAGGGATPQVMSQIFTSPMVILIFACAGLLYFVFYFMLQAALVHGTVAYLNGGRASFLSCLSTGVRVFFPMIGISFLVGWGIILGLILLIVPGIMLAMRWIVSVPVRVTEGPGILSALGRSAELTRGHRWPIFGLVVMLFLAQIMLQAAAAPFMGTFSPQTAATISMTSLAVHEGVNLLVSAVIAMFTAVGAASIYYELRSIKEGIGPEQLAAVFS